MKTWTITKDQAQLYAGLTFGQLRAVSPEFRQYCQLFDCGCGLSKYWLTPTQDPFFKACAVHDFWYDNKVAANEALITGSMVDGWFERDCYQIAAQLGTNVFKSLFYQRWAKLYVWLVKKADRWD